MPRRFGRVAWTDDEIATLKAGWAAGDQASAIAARIQGATKCAVLGKARRLGLGMHPDAPGRRGERKDSAKRSRKAQPRAQVARPARPPRPGVAAIAPDFIPLTVKPFAARRAHECAWAFEVGPRTWLACCARADGPFCAEHAALAYRGTVDLLEEAFA